MLATSIADALEALSSMEKGRPYSLRPEDPKRRLADDLAGIAREVDVVPVVIGGLAVNHHGYLRLTADLDVLLTKAGAAALLRRLRSEVGWKRQGDGFKNTVLGVSVDFCVEGEKTAPGSSETFPNPSELETVDTEPLPVPSLSELIALKVMSGRARDDADVVELLKRHRARIPALRRKASKRLRTPEARERLRQLVARARAELRRRRS
jgi:hypothetical protein